MQLIKLLLRKGSSYFNIRCDIELAQFLQLIISVFEKTDDNYKNTSKTELNLIRGEG